MEPTADDEELTKEEAAAYLGVHPRTLNRYTEANRISSRVEPHKYGQKAFWRKSDLDRLKAELTDKPTVHRPRAEETATPHASEGTSESKTLALASSNPTAIEQLLAAMLERLQQPTPPPAPTSEVAIKDKLVLTLEEAAKLVSYSRSFLAEEIHAGRLKARKTGRGWRIKRTDLEEYVENS